MAEPPLDPPGPGIAGTGGQLLASDQRRDQSVALLSAACADGRLPLEDFSARVDRALGARTVGELSQLEADLGPAPGPVLSVEPHSRRPTWFVAIMSSTARRGRWILQPASHALAVMGDVDLDLRGAEVAASTSHISAVAVMGSIRVIVPEGINVEVDGMAIMGSKTIKGGADRTLPGAPTVVVTAIACMGDVTVVTKGPKTAKLEGEPSPALVDWRDRHQRRAYIRSQRHRWRGGDE
ncbi:MAG TPA: DUF1707 domain-containing protein [Candidatus Dormibacteraeota bacterium]